MFPAHNLDVASKQGNKKEGRKQASIMATCPQTVIVPATIAPLPQRRSTSKGIEQLTLLEGRNNRRNRPDLHHHLQQQKQQTANGPPDVIKAKATVTAGSKQRPLFRRRKITNPAIVTRNNTSLMSLETSATEDSCLSNDADNSMAADSAVVAAVERKVRFRVDDKDEIVLDYLPTKGSRWFQQKPIEGTTTISPVEFRQIISDAKTYIAMIQLECPEIVTILTHMFHNKSLAAGLLSERDTGLLQIWSSSHGRGLEDHLVPDVKQHRTNARSLVLKFQEKMSSIGDHDYYRYSQALRERSCMESQQSAAFARLLAIGDALEAETIHFGKSSSRKFLKK
jgi:hypothetical protein